MVTGMRHPVDTVTEPEPAEILAGFTFASILRLGSWWRAPCFSRHPIRLQKRSCQFCWESIKQNGDDADIACMTGSRG